MPMNEKQWAKCVEILNCGLAGEMPAAQMEVYRRLLADLDAVQVEKACYKLLAENKWLNSKRYPNPAEIREAVQLLTHGQFATAEAAFERAREAVKRYGLDQSEQAHKMCGDTVWKCIKSLGGFERFCDCTPDDRPALFAQFRDAWNRYTSTTQALETLPNGLRPKVVGMPVEKDPTPERKAIEQQLAKIGERVTLPLLDGPVERSGKSPAKREGVSQVVSADDVDPELPMNPAPGDDISRGYYTSYTRQGEQVIRFFSAEAVAELIEESSGNVMPSTVFEEANRE